MLPKTFKHDHILRDKKGIPLARVVFEDYSEGDDIEVIVMDVTKGSRETIEKQDFYADGHKYRIQEGLPDVRFRKKKSGGFIINSFVLQKVK